MKLLANAFANETLRNGVNTGASGRPSGRCARP
jgi:hypothetical protein